jgi:hypothetical protein
MVSICAFGEMTVEQARSIGQRESRKIAQSGYVAPRLRQLSPAAPGFLQVTKVIATHHT